MGAGQTIELYPFILVGSAEPLLTHIQSKASLWFKRGPYVDLPIVCPYNSDLQGLVGTVVQSDRHRIKITQLDRSTGVLVLKLKIRRR